MDDRDAFERRLAAQLDRMAGPGRRIDAMAMVRAVSIPSPGRRFQPVFSAVRFVVAAAIIVLFGGVVLSEVLLVRLDREPTPASVPSSPAASHVAPSTQPVASASPVGVQPVDWVTFDDAAIFRGGGHSGGDVLHDVAMAANGEAVIVGVGGHCEDLEGIAWTRASGGDWRRSALSDTRGAQPSRVLATTEGYVAIGGQADRCRPGQDPVAYLWTSGDGIDWSQASFDGAVFEDIDRVDDTVTILGTLRARPTVWTSRSGGPWEAATIPEQDPSFSPDQLVLSADGTYLVRDSVTGLTQRSEDGLRFTSVDTPDVLPAGDDGRNISTLVRAADGFALASGSVVGQSDDLSVISVSTWLSPDGIDWRLGDAAPGLTSGNFQLGTQGAAAVMWRDRAELSDFSPAHLGFLQADGSWCAVTAPVEPASLTYGAKMAWNEDGRSVVVAGGVVRVPVVWSADGVRCDR